MLPRVGSKAKLAIYLDSPMYHDAKSRRIGKSRAAELLLWILKRMSISLDDVMIDYSLKCYKLPKALSKKPDRMIALAACRKHTLVNLAATEVNTIVAMGSDSCEAFLGGSLLRDKEGASWNTYGTLREQVPKIYVTYAPGFALKTKSEVVRLYRTIFTAAKAAGLKPVFNPKVKHFNYDD